jgi:hypothetical protein
VFKNNLKDQSTLCRKWWEPEGMKGLLLAQGTTLASVHHDHGALLTANFSKVANGLLAGENE